VRPEDIAARVWPGRTFELEPLGGGITNRNFLVELDGEAGRYVLRIGGRDTALLGIDRRVEHEASLVAAALGVGPDVVAFDEQAGYLVTRYIEGRIPPIEEIRRPEKLRSVARTLRHIHYGPPIPGRFDAFRVVEAYSSTAAARGVRLPDAYRDALATAQAIERARGPHRPLPCHNDLLNANFVDDGQAIRIVDWEYAGMGDVFFDLANFSVNHELGEAENGIVLEAYFGALHDADLVSLRLMRFMSDFREAMWGVVQGAVSELDFDFDGYAREHFERLDRTAAEPAFQAGLHGRAE
jgi:thiamine kinase-like enzyme